MLLDKRKEMEEEIKLEDDDLGFPTDEDVSDDEDEEFDEDEEEESEAIEAFDEEL